MGGHKAGQLAGAAPMGPASTHPAEAGLMLRELPGSENAPEDCLGGGSPRGYRGEEQEPGGSWQDKETASVSDRCGAKGMTAAGPHG